jgi:hypothetical protein
VSGPRRSRDRNPIENRNTKGDSSMMVVLTGALMLQSRGCPIGHREPLLKSDGQSRWTSNLAGVGKSMLHHNGCRVVRIVLPAKQVHLSSPKVTGELRKNLGFKGSQNENLFGPAS